MKVKRTEQTWIKTNKRIGELCHISKNLYNEANYVVRQSFFSDGKWTRYNKLYNLLKNSDNYKILPAQTSQQTLKTVDRSWKSFFRAIKEWKKHPEKFKERPRTPRYKQKDGKHLLIFTSQQAKIKDGWLILPPKKVGLKIKTRIKNRLKEVRIIPKGIGYMVEIVYEKLVKITKRKSKNKNRMVGIDIGIRNLVTMGNNIGTQPIVVKGSVAKSINQYFNKQKAKLQSIYDKQNIKTGKGMQKLIVKRERKLNDLFHKISKYVVDWCVQHSIGRIIIGYNKEWKQKVNLGKKNNQTFVSIPFNKLIKQITYKAEEQGIKVELVDEAHTSKCSFLDNESVEHHEEYMGKRISRGLFRTAKGIIINADVNASYNITWKAFPKAFTRVKADGIEGVGLHPIKCNIAFNKYNLNVF